MSCPKSTPYLKDNAKNVRNGDKWRWIVESQSVGIIVGALLTTVLVSIIFFTVQHDRARDAANVRLIVRLAGVEGFDPFSSLPLPPTFHLVVDADGVAPYYEACSGGGNSMLRVSYHGMILAWGHVPAFCIQGDRSTDGVVTVEANVNAAVLREEVRRLVWSEQHVIGKAKFDMEGEVAGLGYLHCKIFLFNTTEENKAPCLVQ